jgi:hypothetical protein
MKEYPSITNIPVKSEYVYVFDKLDGSNIRAEWSKKKGFYKFGTRHRLMDRSEPILGKAVDLILEDFSEPLSKIFREDKPEKAMAFFEFLGPNSFAGTHDPHDEHKVVLLDVSYKKGLLEASDFLKKFQYLAIPACLHFGKINQEFIDKVKSGTLEGMTFEGVVAKGKYVSPGLPLMFKIKNKTWIDKVRAKFQGKAEDLI